MAAEPVLLELSGSFVVVGDIHGSIDDLLQILGNFGYPPDRSYLFLGDYVDRGSNSIEVLLILYSLKVLFPENVYLLRGNHECKAVANKYGFRTECEGYFENGKVYRRFCESFAEMPIAAVVNGRVFCVHGGLSPEIRYLSDIGAQIEKPLTDIGDSIAEHLLWSDPSNECYRFEASRKRKVGFLFSSEVTENFLSDNGLEFMIRAHEFCKHGAHWTFDGCLTLFSNCDYCGLGNTGAVAVLDKENKLEITPIRKCDPEDLAHILQLPQWFLESGTGVEPAFDMDEQPVWLAI
jgi:protein phosphatase